MRFSNGYQNPAAFRGASPRSRRPLSCLWMICLMLSLLTMTVAMAAEDEDILPGCAVNAVQMGGDTISVTWQSDTESAQLHVAVYGDADPTDTDDSSTAYTRFISEQTLTLSDTGGEKKTSDFAFSGLPDYYLVKTWFTSEGESTEEHHWTRQTKAIQMAIHYTPADADGNRYLSLGGSVQTALLSMPEDDSANLATETDVVLSEGSYVLLREGGVILNEDGAMSISQSGDSYTIPHGDAKACALQDGQGICFIDAAGETLRYLFLKISDVTVSGDTVRFTGVSALELPEEDSIFDVIYLKGTKTFQDHYSSSTQLSLETDWAVTFDYEILFVFLQEDYFDIKMNYEFRNGELKLYGPEVNIDLPIRAIVLPLADIVTIKAGIFFNINAIATGSVNFEMTGGTGILLDGFKGHMTTDGPHFAFDPVTFEGDLFLGPKMGPELQIGGNFLSANVGWQVKGGIHIHAKLHGGEGGHVSTQSEDWHACKALKCICGYKEAQLTAKAYANLMKLEIKFQPLNKSWPLGDFHYSWTFGSPEKSDTTCPWYGTRLKVNVVGSDNQPLKSAKVTYTPVHEHFESKASCDTDDKGLAILWPYEGTVSVKGEWTNEEGLKLSATQDVTMKTGEPQEITLKIATRKVTLSFDANATGTVSGMPEALSFYPSAGNIHIPTQTPTLSGNTFLGWAKDKTSPHPDYLPGDECIFPEDTTLYAVLKTMVPEDTWYLVYQPCGGLPTPHGTVRRQKGVHHHSGVQPAESGGLCLQGVERKAGRHRHRLSARGKRCPPHRWSGRVGSLCVPVRHLYPRGAAGALF